MSTARHFAILIGVDCYIRKPLYSCVRDVNLIEAYLETLRQDSGINQLEITKLTASNLPSPPESPQNSATVQNIKENLSRVTSGSSPGDLIYVHFSGHGTVLPGGKLALVPYGCEGEVEGQLVACLPGTDLAELLNVAVRKRVKVLLVLDCCFSGAMTRYELPDAVRYIPYSPVSEMEDANIPQQSEPGFFHSDRTYRGASVDHDWILNPMGYTMLTACSPAQITHAINFGDGKLHGTLSYALVRTLKKLNTFNMSHRVIFQFICAMLSEMKSPQVPQLKGYGDFTFFGDLRGTDDCFFPIVTVPKEQRVILQAGEIMGVREGDKLALSPLSLLASDDWDHSYKLATARNVGGVTAEVELDGLEFAQIGYGWIARLQKLCHHASTTLDIQNDKSSTLLVESSRGLNQDLQENFFLPRDFSRVTAPVKAKINNQNRFEIRDREGRIVDFDAISLLSADSPSARAQVMRILAYLARYLDIVNMKSSVENERLRSTVEIQLRSNSGVLFTDEEINHFENGDSFQLLITNNGKESVFVNIFGFQNWEIENILKADNTLVDTGKNIELGIRMNIPEQLIQRGINVCEDIFKIFITTRPVPLANLAADKPLSRGSSEKWEDELRDSWMVRTYRIRTT